ncbi:hypothetical protein LY632_06890 [Erythrobacter sp. SDW2]|uniref:hypothetical protein n=1 Tax=Erythrobacter sp. SDW2 TaxID=2907154 RepID=UPI001F328C30|nr:hypothetical protein [Erythrobacter sp. SDW2]UIP08114.1 hypothetical protein LY632_06890 [Erythrobacter sp. SDW2]
MTRAAEIAADPAWLPHRIDVPAQQVEFILAPRETLGQRGFLADRDPSAGERALVGWDDLRAMQAPGGRLHFIFHTAFCRSTLLVRALDAPGVAAGLNEPGIIASLVNAGDAAAPLIAPLLALLARPHAPGEVVVVKPTNHANRLMPALLRVAPQARAVLMSNELPVFLRSVARKGLMGRNWGRKLFLELQSYAGMDFGMDPRETFAMSDMQAAGLAWLLNQRFFALHLGGQVQGVAPDRLRMLDGDRFDAARAETLAAVFAHFGVGVAEELPAQLAAGPVFSQHAKLGGEFAGDDSAGIDPKLEEEIAQVGQWVGLIAQQAGLRLPLPQTLF